MEADSDIVICYGGAKPTDTHLASKVVAIDEEIIEWLERRERRRKMRHKISFFLLTPNLDMDCVGRSVIRSNRSHHDAIVLKCFR
jgi:hypothetical protein